MSTGRQQHEANYYHYQIKFGRIIEKYPALIAESEADATSQNSKT